MNYDVAIIGAGMSGLAAGIRCAHYGKKTVLFDRHYLWGGLNSFYRLKGLRFDVGLHALTNFVPKQVKSAPLPKLLRQLRIAYDDLDLSEQIHSEIAFPGKRLRFTNQFEYLRQEIREQFPDEIDRFDRLTLHIREYNELDLTVPYASGREVVSSFLADPLLAEMLFCPLMFYGSAHENDMDFGQFVVMFKSIFMEGFARPRRGVRQVLDILKNKYKELGGELRMKTGVKRIEVRDGSARSLALDGGEEVNATQVLSSAGLVETERLCSDTPADAFEEDVGRLTFTESISVLDADPKTLGHDYTILFYNDSDKFRYRAPDDFIDPSSAVVCCPNNYHYDRPLEQNMIRVTHIAGWKKWRDLEGDAYRAQKEKCLRRSYDAVTRWVPPFKERTVFTDHFTPRTIYKFTGHLGGAVYGSPRKIKTGQTRLNNLFLIGTDQGFLGVIGAMLSGISMANRHVLMADATP